MNKLSGILTYSWIFDKVGIIKITKKAIYSRKHYFYLDITQWVIYTYSLYKIIVFY